jgi:hypothetical protein
MLKRSRETGMNIRLNPHSEQLLKEELARGHFHSAEEVIERALETLQQGGGSSAPHGRTRPSLDQLRCSLDALAEGSDKIPALPTSAFSRENIYQDHP